MKIASKHTPRHNDRTYFSSGRAAFAFLVERTKPTKVYLPAYSCWSLVTTMLNRFPDIPIQYYAMNKYLDGKADEMLWPEMTEGGLFVRIHYFGKQNSGWVIHGGDTVLDDLSHSHLSNFEQGEAIQKGTYEFGSYRKVLTVGDGGFINTYFNPMYEPSKKLDTWLRYESADWRDMREAENMLDRDWQIADISGQSLAAILTADMESIRQQRQNNERYLDCNLASAGRGHIYYKDNECPLLHSRLFETMEERDSLKEFLITKDVFTSIHYPIHPHVVETAAEDILESAQWLSEHSLAFPVSQEYNLNDMEYIATAVEEWKKSGT